MSDGDRVAVAHDHFYRWGGGEHVACELGRTFDCPVYTSFAHRKALKRTPSYIDVRELIEGHPLEGVFRNHLQDSGARRTLFYMFLWELAPSLREYDVIVQSGNNPGWYVPDDDQTIIKYTHSTPRQAYDLFGGRGDTLDRTPWRHPLHALGVLSDRGMKKATRYMWSPTATYPTLYVANSDVVAARLKKYLGIPEEKIRVVYPPVDVSAYAPRDGGDYYLSLGRLSYHKNTDTIIRAFAQLGEGYPLKVAGTGPKGDELRELAEGADNIEFLGFVTDEEKRALYSRAKATVFMADNEDFGLVPVESMAAGTPVLGVEDGFTEFQIRDGENGMYAPLSTDGLADTVAAFDGDGVAWDAGRINRFAQQFGYDRFREQMHNAVETAVEMDRIEPEMHTPQVVEADD